MTDATPLELFEGVRPYGLDFDDYVAMIGAGVFGDANVELVDGELIELAPSQTRHSRVLSHVHIALGIALQGKGFELYIDAIAKIGPKSGRAPDISVVDRDIGDRTMLLPEDILLAIEISDSTLSEDLGRKCKNYAAADIRHYWVVDVEGEQVHCFSDPARADYRTVVVTAFSEALALPGCDASIVVAG
jgi:Uma2 family endonuclease